jgi:hypothetical protein
MADMTRTSRLLSFVLLTIGGARVSRAQQAPVAPAPAPACDYRACALGIVPNWSGLAVTRGVAGPRVANLSFFWPRDVSAVLRGTGIDVAGADSAAAQARRAVGLRRSAAALTDAGIVLGAIAAGRALSAGRMRRADGMIAAAGAAAFGVSVPLQFAADGALSRAVWWHNLRFAR